MYLINRSFSLGLGLYLIFGLLNMNVSGLNTRIIRATCSRMYGRKSLSKYDDVGLNINKKNKNVGGVLTPKTSNQRLFIKQLTDPKVKIVVCGGPAGSGKTFLACRYAVNSLNSGVVRKIIMTRPTITVADENIGFLPGTMEIKMNPYIRPLLDVLNDQYSSDEIGRMFEEGVLEIVPLGFMRGRTFSDSVIIADEMQNSTPEQMLMLTTRIGENSKLVITGDAMQSDIKIGKNGLTDFISKLYLYKERYDMDDIRVVIMEEMDVVRSAIVKTVLNVFNMDEVKTDDMNMDEIKLDVEDVYESQTQNVKVNLIESAKDVVLDVSDNKYIIVESNGVDVNNDCAMIPQEEYLMYKKYGLKLL